MRITPFQSSQIPGVEHDFAHKFPSSSGQTIPYGLASGLASKEKWFLKQNHLSPSAQARAGTGAAGLPVRPLADELENACKSGKGIRPTKEGGMFAEEARRGTTLPGFAAFFKSAEAFACADGFGPFAVTKGQ